MAEILGLGSEVSDDLHNELEYLHQETQPALQVYVRYVELALGRYARKGEGSGAPFQPVFPVPN